jgi:hypothetical protein
MAKKNVYQRRKPRRKLTRAERSFRIAENLFKGYVRVCAQRLSRDDMISIVNQYFDELFVEETMQV